MIVHEEGRSNIVNSYVQVIIFKIKPPCISIPISSINGKFSIWLEELLSKFHYRKAATTINNVTST